MAQGIGLHAASKEAAVEDVFERERRRRIWYCLFILDRLVALQLGGAVLIRDPDFSVDLPTAVNGDPPEAAYLCEMSRLSKVIGYVIDHLYRPAQSVIRLEQLLETIAVLDAELISWRDGLPPHLRFDRAHPFESNIIFKRQRNFLGIKFHHLRTLIHRPCLCLETLHHDELDEFAQNRGVGWDHAASQLAEATCIMEARETIQMLDGVMNKRGLLWEFPWWQMISCLMCAQSVIMITRIVYPQYVDSAGLQADMETCYNVLEALRPHSAAAERCLKMIDVMRKTQFSDQGRFNCKVSGFLIASTESSYSDDTLTSFR
jgi:Fungal specific transcription factor domain